MPNADSRGNSRSNKRRSLMITMRIVSPRSEDRGTGCFTTDQLRQSRYDGIKSSTVMRRGGIRFAQQNDTAGWQPNTADRIPSLLRTNSAKPIWREGA